jgi:adenylate cyclase
MMRSKRAIIVDRRRHRAIASHRSAPYRHVMTVAEYQAAGLYDPAAPNAADRLALLEWLAARGITLAQMVEAQRERTLSGIAGDLALRPGPRLTARDIARQHGLTVDQVLAVSLAAGLPPRTADEPGYTLGDGELFATFVGGAAMFGEAATLRFTRVIGSSLARIAEAAVSLFQVNVEGPLRESGSELAIAKENLRAIESLEGVRSLLREFFSSHIETAIRRLREARADVTLGMVRLAVGFVDLVGFTAIGRRFTPREFVTVVERFEETAYDTVAARDGRVVKLIGDEVMFVVRDPAAACEVALTLVERFADDPAVTPRGGLAWGEVLYRGGDYYGPTVNLAARLAQIAVPGELLVTTDVATESRRDALRFEPAGKRMLKGFDEPVALLAVARD